MMHHGELAFSEDIRNCSSTLSHSKHLPRQLRLNSGAYEGWEMWGHRIDRLDIPRYLGLSGQTSRLYADTKSQSGRLGAEDIA